MEPLEQVRQIYEDYLTEIRQLEANRKPGEGLLGIGKGPADHPCNDQFVSALETALGELARQPDPRQIPPVLRYMYEIPLGYRELKTAYWMLLAVHGLTLESVGRLQPPEAEAIRDWYAEHYPPRDRLPAQKQVLKALKHAAQAR